MFSAISTKLGSHHTCIPGLNTFENFPEIMIVSETILKFGKLFMILTVECSRIFNEYGNVRNNSIIKLKNQCITYFFNL